MASPNRLLSLAKYVEPNRANSLKQYIYNLILTYYFDDKSPLFGLVNGKLDKLFDIADLRNEKGHGQTETSGEVSMITEAAAESCYSFIKEFFNKYMTVAL
jgi:cyclophilin family peptidyl-prolyl cis-trans isomerase